MKTKIKFILLMTVLLMVCSCSPARRLERLIERHPELVTSDTARVNDTVITRDISTDTALLLTALPAGVIIQKDRLEIALNKVHDTLFLRGRCKPDTIIRKITVPYERIRIIKTDTNTRQVAGIPWLIIAIVSLGCLGGIVVFKLKK
jgi:hypothetical protein